MRDRPYTLYRTTCVAPAARVAAIGSLVLLALGPVAVTALALGRDVPDRGDRDDG